MDSDGNAYIVGYTQSTNFPTTEFAFQRRNAGREDAFVCKFDANGSRQMFSTLIGGTLRDRGSDITLMTNDSVALVGETYSRNFPTSGGPEQNTNAGGREAFVVVFESNGSDLEYSTYLGGSSGDWGLAQVLSSDGFIIATGISQSLDFPTTDDAYQSNHVGKHDIFVSKIERDLDGPFADAGPDQIVDQHTNVSFNGSLSTDDYGIATWTWMFEYEGTEIRLFQALPHFVFDVAGVYEVILNVTDGAGFWAIDRMNVTVLDTTPPYAFAGMDVVIDQHGTVFLDGTGSTDNVGIVNWTWEFTYAGDEVTLYHYNVT